jgi:hypothetical protein
VTERPDNRVQLTAMQADRIRLLREEYGREDVLSIEHRDRRRGAAEDTFGLVRMRWGVPPMVGRELTIRPDGTRLAWASLELPT